MMISHAWPVRLEGLSRETNVDAQFFNTKKMDSSVRVFAVLYVTVSLIEFGIGSLLCKFLFHLRYPLVSPRMRCHRDRCFKCCKVADEN